MKAYNSPNDELRIENDSGEELVKITSEKTTVHNLDVGGSGTYVGWLVEPTGTISITENGTEIDVAQYAKANVNVSGAFRTATVGVMANTGPIEIILPHIASEGGLTGTIGRLIIGNDDITLQAVLYDTGAAMLIDDANDYDITLHGDISEVPDITGLYAITGDCTITIDEKQLG